RKWPKQKRNQYGRMQVTYPLSKITDDNKDGETSIDTKNKGMRNNTERYMNNATIPRKESSSDNDQYKTHNEKNGVYVSHKRPVGKKNLSRACEVWKMGLQSSIMWLKLKMRTRVNLRDTNEDPKRREIAKVEVNLNNEETLGKDYKRPTEPNSEKEEK
ncbi:2223_t:CDS:2, partial [Gigaspora margarita]